MNKSFLRGLLLGAGVSLFAILAGAVIAGCAINAGGRHTIAIGTPTAGATRTADLDITITPEVKTPDVDPVSTATPEPAVTQAVSGNTGAEIPGNTPTPTPTRNVSYNISKDLLKDDFEDKLLLLGQIIEAYYYQPVAVEDLQEGLYKGIMSAVGDPYTCYYTPEEYDALNESTSGTYCGIGAYVSQNVNTMIITIVKPFVDGPAYKAGMRAEDVIYKVDGIDVTSMDINNVVAMMKGPEGTQVVVTVYRDGEYIDLTITRAFITVPTVEHEMKDGNIGYIQVSSFDEVTGPQFISAVDDLTSKGMKGLIIDLRDNTGGLLMTCIDMADYILDQDKLIVYTKDRDGLGDNFYSDDGHSVNVPIVILINGYSASASEVFTGALKDHGVAYTIGTKSFGKGIVQSILPLTDGSAVKLTTSSYFCPSGVCVHGVGIEPDTEVILDKEAEEDNQIKAAIEYLQKNIR